MFQFLASGDGGSEHLRESDRTITARIKPGGVVQLNLVLSFASFGPLAVPALALHSPTSGMATELRRGLRAWNPPTHLVGISAAHSLIRAITAPAGHPPSRAKHLSQLNGHPELLEIQCGRADRDHRTAVDERTCSSGQRGRTPRPTSRSISTRLPDSRWPRAAIRPSIWNCPSPCSPRRRDQRGTTFSNILE
jgi:hypothetical protein